ncbi:hypothetical protein F4820DRAFT_450630 [Hypoxylon rubiginosum]|uniref:Uncharacterized protein n=1 Tax=Hypoxylon rubiginosum TaxID=110542 RepID=A0ACB9YU84_9PEZI|nr:hypothetical protein F4820DRAFT_450630 [Hypoxylon rubiginosum]
MPDRRHQGPKHGTSSTGAQCSTRRPYSSFPLCRTWGYSRRNGLLVVVGSTAWRAVRSQTTAALLLIYSVSGMPIGHEPSAKSNAAQSP